MKSRKEQGGLYDSGIHVSTGPKLKGRNDSRCTWLQYLKCDKPVFAPSFEGNIFWWALVLGKAISLYHQLGVIRITVSAMFKSSRREDMIPR